MSDGTHATVVILRRGVDTGISGEIILQGRAEDAVRTLLTAVELPPDVGYTLTESVSGRVLDRDCDLASVVEQNSELPVHVKLSLDLDYDADVACCSSTAAKCS